MINQNITGRLGSLKKIPIINQDFIEAPVGFEPTNKGFADLRLKPLGYSAKNNCHSLILPFLERETGLEPATSTLARLRSTN
jgi:hypothetical protein